MERRCEYLFPHLGNLKRPGIPEGSLPFSSTTGFDVVSSVSSVALYYAEVAQLIPGLQQIDLFGDHACNALSAGRVRPLQALHCWYQFQPAAPM